MEILTLLKANIKYKKSSFISILMLMLVITSVLTSVISIKNNMKKRAYDSHHSVDTGDIILFTEHKHVTDDLLTKVKACNSVSRIKVNKCMLLRNKSINGKELSSKVYIEGFSNNSYPYELFNEEGNAFVTHKPRLMDNEILLPISMKDTVPCKIGDTMSFDIGIEKIDLKIGGFIEEPFSGSNILRIKSLVVTDQLFNIIRERSNIEKAPDNKYIWDADLIHIFATKEYQDNINEVSKDINKSTNIVSLSFTSMTKEQSISITLLVTELICGVLQGFAMILFVVVMLVLSNNINSSIEMDYTNIGILKSQGFTKLQIRLVLLIQYLLSGLMGILLGILIAIPLVHMLASLFIPTSGLLFSGSIALLKSAGILSIILLILAVLILIKTRKISKISPVNAISGGLNNIYFKSLLQTPVIGKSKSFLNLKLAFRQLTTNTSWYIGSCLIIGLLVSFLCLAASFNETFTEKSFNEMFGVKMSDVSVKYGDYLSKQPEVEATITAITPIEKKLFQGSQYVLTDQEQNYVQVLDDTSYFKTILEGRAPKYDNEIVVTNLVSDLIGKKVGETVEIQYQKTKKDFIISGIYDSCSEVGRCLGMTLEGILQLNPEFKIDAYEYFLKDPQKANEVMDAINTTFSKTNHIIAQKPTMMDPNSMDSIMIASNMAMLCIYIISVLFVIIVICMICNKMFLKERQSLGIYKAFGFTATNLRFQYCFRFLLTAIFGCFLGGTVFVLFGNTLNSGILQLAGISSFWAPITWFNLGLPVIVICITVLLASFITMRKIKKIEVTSLIIE